MAKVETIEVVKNALSEVLGALEFPFDTIEVSEENKGIVRANIDTDRAPFLIGTFGERINALQHILPLFLHLLSLPPLQAALQFLRFYYQIIQTFFSAKVGIRMNGLCNKSYT